LPFLRGFEPDTVAVLEGYQSIHGTIHKVEEDFDTGAILWETEEVPLRPYETPASLLHRVTYAFIQGIPRFLLDFHEQTLVLRAQEKGDHHPADRKWAIEQSQLRWKTDNHEMLDRRFRAFNGQPFPIHLKAIVDGEMIRVLDMELIQGDYPGDPGESLGLYNGPGPFRGATLVRTLEGAAALKLGHRCALQNPSCLDTGRCQGIQEYILPARTRMATLQETYLPGASKRM